MTCPRFHSWLGADADPVASSVACPLHLNCLKWTSFPIRGTERMETLRRVVCDCSCGLSIGSFYKPGLSLSYAFRISCFFHLSISGIKRVNSSNLHIKTGSRIWWIHSQTSKGGVQIAWPPLTNIKLRNRSFSEFHPHYTRVSPAACLCRWNMDKMSSKCWLT